LQGKCRGPAELAVLLKHFHFMSLSESPVERALDDLLVTANLMRPMAGDILQIGEVLRDKLLSGSKVMTAGNGGSASDALHLAEELVGRFDKERRSLPAICISADPTLLTCIGNDYGFENLFSRQIEGLGRPGDALVVFSTSGNSPNIVNAIYAAKDRGISTIAILGKTGGRSKGLSDFEIIVPSSVTARIQEIHTFILHSWLSIIEVGL
jgi:phosphoheptose isomerase